jgi:hypothetical protein
VIGDVSAGIGPRQRGIAVLSYGWECCHVNPFLFESFLADMSRHAKPLNEDKAHDPVTLFQSFFCYNENELSKPDITYPNQTFLK